MKFFRIITVFSSLLVASFSHAKDVRGFYVGAGVGATSLDDEDNFWGGYNKSEDGNTYKLIAGYQVNRILAFEAQYTNYGDINFSLSSQVQNALPSLPQDLKQHRWSPEALSFTANAGYTFNSGLRPFGILGLSMLDLNESKKIMSEDKYLGLRYGFGLEYTPPALNALSVRVAYEADFFYAEEKTTRYGIYSSYTVPEIYDFTLDSAYVSVSYRF